MLCQEKSSTFILNSPLNCTARVIFGGDRREHVTPLLRDELHWLRARERITFKLCLLVYKARNGMAPNTYRTCVCRCQLFLPALLSAPWLVETRSSLGPDDVSGTEHSASPILRRGTVCHRTFVLHQHCVLSKICSRLICFFPFISIIYLISRSVCCTAPLQ